MASKTLAERAAWTWYEKNKSSISWDLVTLNPPYVFGPIIHECKGVESLNTSAGLWYAMVLKGGALADSKTLADGNNWVDVRDISYASVLALLKEEAANNRFIISPGSFIWQEFVAAAHKYVPSLPAGDASIDVTKRPDIVVDGSKSKKVLGITYRTFEETSKDTIVDLEQKGWWKA
ncbi:hypothetical protein QCA50_009635 [Cerrena zonata]|uniref:Uncharacterized protein n=1 Tax=Cerrena zonata TaxID=2478898 RepID=A0AAW0GB56_9APHY